VNNTPISNAYGQFDPTGRRFVISNSRTPVPWVNVLSNGRYGVALSQNGGGFSWLDNSQLNVLTRWEMDLARDDHGRFLYLADLESGDVWSAAPAPCQPKYTRYQCEHTQGRTTFSTEHLGIAAEWTLAVAPEDSVEVWRVTLSNKCGRARKLRISSFFEWCCGAAPDTKREFHRLFLTTTHHAARRAITADKNMWDLPTKDEREHWNKPWPFVAAHAVGGVTFDNDLAIGDKRAFSGLYTHLTNPAAMTVAKPPQPKDLNVFGRFGDASAALGGDLTLAAGQTVTIVYTLAIADDEAAVLGLVDKYTQPKAVDEAIRGADKMWETLLAPSWTKSGMADFDLLNSTWLPYQAISGRLWGRTGYYQQSGAFGFRDQLQDSQIWLGRDPARTRAQILLHAAHQFVDGSVYHWWHPLPGTAEFGLHTKCSDDYLWLPFLTAQYIKETGDKAILNATAPFVDDKGPVSLLEHCVRSIKLSLARQSPRGLPLIGSCDWNDGLSAMGVGEKGESVWLAQWLAQLLSDFAHVIESSGASAPYAALPAEYRAARTKLIAAINAHAWDGDSGGQWYRAATRDDGRWIGTAANTEGRIFLNTQTWAILSETAPKEREDAAWESLKEHLLQPMGPLLSHPAYTEPDASIGYITRYAPGLRENGGVYMHAATWALAAACKRRDVRAVESIWRSVSPPLRGQDANAYWAEPYVMPGNVDGPASSTPGKAGWTWYTGSAAWLNRVSMEWVVGMRPEWDGLRIDPCPFPAMGRVSAARLWRGKSVRVSFDASEFSPNLPPKLTVNGCALESGNLILEREFANEKSLEISVSWGLHVKPRTAGAVYGSGAVAATDGLRAHPDRKD
jgi:cellobiose phosphorylase